MSAGALSPDAEDKLLARLTDLLLQHEGADPANPPHARTRGSLCTYNDERRQAVTAVMTQAVADAEAGSRPDPSSRVWVLTAEGHRSEAAAVIEMAGADLPD